MKFMLSIHGDSNIASQIAADLMNLGAGKVNNSRCLCHYDLEKEVIAAAATEGADLLIYHPARDTLRDYLRCWEIHKAVIAANPQQRFYVFAMFNPDIIDFIGEMDNVKYFQGRSVRRIWDEIVGLAKK
jgi:hypothetical protein